MALGAGEHSIPVATEGKAPSMMSFPQDILHFVFLNNIFPTKSAIVPVLSNINIASLHLK